MKKLVLLSIAALALLPWSASGQTSSFTGEWVLKNSSRATKPVVWTIDQSPGDINLQVSVAGHPVRNTTWVFGSETPVEAGSVSIGRAMTRASFLGNEVRFVGDVPTKNKKRAKVTESWGLSADHNLLQVVTVVEIGPGQTFTNRQTFTRVR
jgi:hypothetical protein